MNPEDVDKIAAPVAKVVTAWSLVGVSNLAEAATLFTAIASALAAFYTFLLMSEWFWKRLWKPLFTHFGLFGFKRRIITLEQDAAMEKDE